MCDWYLVYCKPRQEDAAQKNLLEQAYNTYLPKMRVRRRRAQGMVELEQPLFPRYLFLSPGHEAQPIAPAQYTSGVQNVVRFGTDYLPVPYSVVAALKSREDPETGLHNLKAPAFEPGERLRIAAGALAGVEGVFEARTGQDRVIILLDLLGQQARTEVRLDELDR